MKFLKFLLFCIFIAIPLFCIGWVNIWVAPHHVAIVRVESFSETDKNPTSVSVITRKGFSWLWQRFVPGLTSIVELEDTLRTYTFDMRFTLPNAFEYAALSSESIESFILDATVDLQYTIERSTVSKYVEQNSIISAHALERILLTEISSAASRLLRKNSHLIEKNTTALDIQKNIKSRLQSEVSSLPIHIETVTVKIINEPNIVLYQYMQDNFKNMLNKSPLNNTNSEEIAGFKNNKDALIFYLHFIQRLTGLVGANPKIKEIMNIIPPQDILPE